MPGTKYPILSAKSLFLGKSETKEPIFLHGKKIPHTRVLSGDLKNLSIMVEHTHVEV